MAELRNDDLPLNLEELERARNRIVRQGIRRVHEMKPQELIGFAELLDGEIASRRVQGGEVPGNTKKTRAEMIQALQPAKKSGDESP